MQTTELNFDGTLLALMDWIDCSVRITVGGVDPVTDGQVVMVEGTLTAKWDPEVTAANVGDAALFRLAGTDFTLAVVKADFRSASRLENGSVHVLTGGVNVEVGAPFVIGNPA